MEAGPKRMEALDGLRGLSALVIFCFHASVLHSYVPSGGLAVTVFFLLSGFLITTLLYNEWTRTGSIDLLHFYWRRAVRLVPAAAFFFACLFGVFTIFVTPPVVYRQTFLNGQTRPDVVQAALQHFASVTNWTLTGDRDYTPLTHFWSLSIEQQFYFAWPVMLLGLLALRRVWLAMAVVAVLALLSLFYGVLVPGASFRYVNFATQSVAYQLLFGCLAALFVARVPSFRVPSIAIVAALAGLVALVTHAFGTAGAQLERELTVLFATVVVVGCAARGNLTARVLAVRPLTYLGSRSYAFYMWHAVFCWWFARLPAYNQVAGAFLASMFMAEVSYRYVEHPAMQFGRRFKGSHQIPSLASLFRGRDERPVELAGLATIAQTAD